MKSEPSSVETSNFSKRDFAPRLPSLHHSHAFGVIEQLLPTAVVTDITCLLENLLTQLLPLSFAKHSFRLIPQPPNKACHAILPATCVQLRPRHRLHRNNTQTATQTRRRSYHGVVRAAARGRHQTLVDGVSVVRYVVTWYGSYCTVEGMES